MSVATMTGINKGLTMILTLMIAFLGYTTASSPIQCENHCDIRKCPVVTKDNCDGLIIKDKCDCCPHCDVQSPTTGVIVPTAPSNGTKCKDVTCPKLRICMVNIQGLPLCRCPSLYVCQVLMRPVCGRDGKTYFSRCHMRIAACNRGRKIPLSYRGECEGDKIDVNKLTVKQRRLYTAYMKKHNGKPRSPQNKNKNGVKKHKNGNGVNTSKRGPYNKVNKERRRKRKHNQRKKAKKQNKKNAKKRKNYRRKFYYRLRY